MKLVKATFTEIVNSVGSKREFWTGSPDDGYGVRHSLDTVFCYLNITKMLFFRAVLDLYKYCSDHTVSTYATSDCLYY